MSEPEAIFARVRELLGETDTLAGKTVLVTAGGTREPLDSVRFVGNRSSGRMGVALAEEARRRGADVTLLAANLAVPPPAGVEVVETPTAADLAREAKARSGADVVLMAAAVADYAPEPVDGKRPKSGEPLGDQPAVRPRTSSRASGRAKNGTLLVGFGAEEGEAGLERKRRMLAEKHLDLVVFNDVSRADIGFDASDNEVVLVSAAGERTVPKAPKERIAAEILDEVETALTRAASLNPPDSSSAAMRASSGGWVSNSALERRADARTPGSAGSRCRGARPRASRAASGWCRRAACAGRARGPRRRR